MEKEEIEAEARLLAIEYLIRHVLRTQLMGLPDPVGVARQLRQNLRDGLSRESIQGLEPALSDHLVGEIERAIDVQLQAVEEAVAVERSAAARKARDR